MSPNGAGPATHVHLKQTPAATHGATFAGSEGPVPQAHSRWGPQHVSSHRCPMHPYGNGATAHLAGGVVGLKSRQGISLISSKIWGCSVDPIHLQSHQGHPTEWGQAVEVPAYSFHPLLRKSPRLQLPVTSHLRETGSRR